MASCSAIDAMLKERNYPRRDENGRERSLFARIEQAAKDNVITDDMKEWAHFIRLEANDQRHADDQAPLPTPERARLVAEFARTLAEILFVLPSRVRRGKAAAAEVAKEEGDGG
jgi:hypothetical protein